MEETSQEIEIPDEVSVDLPLELPGIELDQEEEEKLSDQEMIMIIRGERPERIPQEVFKILRKKVEIELKERRFGKYIYTSSFLETKNNKVKKVNNVPYVKHLKTKSNEKANVTTLEKSI